jgi:hypothetical protein
MVFGGTVLGITYWRWVIPVEFKVKIRKALGLSKEAGGGVEGDTIAHSEPVLRRQTETEDQGAR